jgi:hypothetical protein
LYSRCRLGTHTPPLTGCVIGRNTVSFMVLELLVRILGPRESVDRQVNYNWQAPGAGRHSNLACETTLGRMRNPDIESIAI